MHAHDSISCSTAVWKWPHVHVLECGKAQVSETECKDGRYPLWKYLAAVWKNISVYNFIDMQSLVICKAVTCTA